MRKEKNERRRKLGYIAIAAILLAIIIFISIYTYMSNSINSSTKASLETFQLTSASSIPTVEGAELNITFNLRNPTHFPIVIETISITFSIDDIDIRGVSIDLNETIAAGESRYFYFYPPVTNEHVLNSLQNETYKLRVTEGSWIGASASFLFFQAYVAQPITLSALIQNPQAKS